MIHPTKPAFESKNIPSANITTLAQLFPSCITESRGEDGKLKQTVDFEKLRALLGSDIAQGDESYNFTWVGKKAAMQEAGIPVRKTLRPCTEESRDWDKTQNLYIEGDNLDVLKLLQESYLKKVKMIYIDPPYNTGNDFIYNDHFETDKDEYEEGTGAVDDSGIKNFQQNNDANPRFHSDWCSMIYPRLVLARNLLTDDGVIFISIDDNEVDDLRKICNEIFGNYICEFPRVTKRGGKSSETIAKNHDYILMYSKNKNPKLYPIEHNDAGFKFKDEYFNERGFYKLNQTLDYDSLQYSSSLDYPLVINDETFYPGSSKELYEERKSGVHDDADWAWRWSKKKFDFGYSNGFVEIKRTKKNIRIYTKTYQHATIEDDDSDGYFIDYEDRTKCLSTLETTDNSYSNDIAKKDLGNIIGKKLFDYSKPVSLIKLLLKLATEENDIVLDFFSGSATTAEAVMTLNLEKLSNQNRHFILIQLPEKTKTKSNAYKAGYKTICDIGKERIRRAGDKIKVELKKKNENKSDVDANPQLDLTAENTDNSLQSNKLQKLTGGGISIQDKEIHDSLDIGFRVFKVDDSNMKDVYYSAEETSQKMLAGLESNIKEDRTDMDLLYGCLLDWGLPLSLPHTSETIDGVTVHTVNNGDLIACFNADIPESAIRTIAQRKPLRAVFRDSSFATSPEKINVTEIFKTISPTTGVKVI